MSLGTTHLHPVQPPVDAKDWTWVLDRACPECGFDAGDADRHDFGRLTLAYADAVTVVVDHPGATVRPRPDVWSATEYACHVRDVCRVTMLRLDLMLTEDDPLFPNWDQDATALQDGYAATPATAAADELDQAAEDLAARWTSLTDRQWARPGRRSNGSRFTVETLARYVLHDLAHHAWDVHGRPHRAA